MSLMFRCQKLRETKVNNLSYRMCSVLSVTNPIKTLGRCIVVLDTIFLHAICLFCKRAYRGNKPEESFWMRIQESFLPSFPFFHLLLHWVRQPFLGIPPFISDPGSLCLFFILIFCESCHVCVPTYVHMYCSYDT